MFVVAFGSWCFTEETQGGNIEVHVEGWNWVALKNISNETWAGDFISTSMTEVNI
jgi:hypothetical protein